MPNLDLVVAELAYAKRKHRKFVDAFFIRDPAYCDSPKVELERARKRLRLLGRRHEMDFRAVFEEEFWEAVVAYHDGEIEHAVQELAQCAAVVLRAMEHIQGK